MSVSYSESLKLVRSLMQAGKSEAEALQIVSLLGIRQLNAIEREAEELKAISNDRIISIVQYIANLKVGNDGYDKVSFARRWTAKYWDRTVIRSVVAGKATMTMDYKPTDQQCIDTWANIAPATRLQWYNLYAENTKFAAAKDYMFPKAIGIPATR